MTEKQQSCFSYNSRRAELAEQMGWARSVVAYRRHYAGLIEAATEAG